MAYSTGKLNDRRAASARRKCDPSSFLILRASLSTNLPRELTRFLPLFSNAWTRMTCNFGCSSSNGLAMPRTRLIRDAVRAKHGQNRHIACPSRHGDHGP
jgi:hypothetical protein